MNRTVMDFYNLVNHATMEIIDGLAYQRHNGIAHRDLKTANILVSDQHYSSSPGDDKGFKELYRSSPIACKQTDFRES